MKNLTEECMRGEAQRVVCLVAPYMPTVSETFIRGHIEQLPAKVVLVHSWPPSIGNRPVLSSPVRIAYKVRRRFSGAGAEPETTAGYIAAFRRSGAEAVLAEYGDSGVAAMEACRRLQIPLIVHFHGYDASVHDVLKENAETYPAMFKVAAAIIAVSRAMERKLITLGASPEKVHYNPYGINCDNFSGADPSSAEPVFLAVGRFVEKKAPQLTIRAFANVLQIMPEARLRMVGDGPLLEECRALVGELMITDAVTFLGAQTHEAVSEEMRSARCFVQHSVEAANGDCEGTPVGILEAGASGLPVVSTRHAGIPDVVLEGETGFLVDERDVDSMAEHMLRLAQNTALAGRLGLAARKRIESEFSETRSLGQLWAIIESCLDKSRAVA
jgi:glycosyltransferase involved in cell wall biosynthesis